MIQGCKTLCFSTLRIQTKIQSRCMSLLSREEAKEKRSQLFEKEMKKQRSNLGRLEKIEVNYESPVDEITFVMNKDISTPHDCAKHISEGVARVSALALVDGVPWDMHKPFTSNCKLQFVQLQSPKTGAVNTAFWRTCSFLLGALADTAFKPEVEVQLHSFPVPQLKSGSFLYDVCINLPDWKPTDAELRAMSAQYMKLASKELPIECLETTEQIALEMFQDNPFKLQQIPEIAKANNEKVKLYRAGNHVDISKGPMVTNTELIGRCTIAAIHNVSTPEVANLYRFQGIALPKGIVLNHFAYSILEDRAKKLNNAIWMPHADTDDMEDVLQVSAKN